MTDRIVPGLGISLPKFELPLPKRTAFEGTAFHYTSAAGFEAILRTKTLLASEATRLNDLSEVTRGWQIIESWLNELDQEDDMVQVIRHFAPETRRAATTVFILSATEVSDDAHQWRSYADEGTGYAVGLDCSRELSPAADPLPESSVSFQIDSTEVHGWHRLMYEEQEVRAALDDVLQAARPFWQDMKGSTSLEPEMADAIFGKGVFSCLSEIAHLHKHPGFSSEREVRLVVSDPADDHVRYRVGQQGLLGYVTLATATEPDRTRRPVRPGTVGLPPQRQLPITTVAIGPRQIPFGDGLQREQRLARTRAFLELHDLGSATLSMSDIPMR